MKTSLFGFNLPETLIATEPARPRDSARLLVVGETLEDRGVRDLPQLLRRGDVMIFNDTRVIPARLLGWRGKAAVEILLHMQEEESAKNGLVWQAFAKPAKKLCTGDIVAFAPDFAAGVLGRTPEGLVRLAFFYPRERFYALLSLHGHTPLPPYIRRADALSDRSDYQTVYAQHEGAVAAPTAGLHFTPELLAELDRIGVERHCLTLHVGAGTFLPVKADDTSQHVMHEERYTLPGHVAEAINRARAEGRRVIAVGTTSARVLESCVDENGEIQAGEGSTKLFITPGFQFRAVDVLLTNFHLPCSTLFMLVSAFSGLERMQAAYAHAIRQHYRFYSYGDACLLYKEAQFVTGVSAVHL